VTYQLFFDGDWPITYPAILYSSENITIYQTKPFLKEVWDGGKIKTEMPPYTSTKKMIPDGYLKIDHNAKELLTFESLPKNRVLVTDNYPELEWQISNETKEIGGYHCTKAITSYRGRNWIAWFSPDIALPYGPWKLHGLPGLILEAYDVEKIFIIRSTKVEYAKEFNKSGRGNILYKENAPSGYELKYEWEQ
jgi:GLPGLI family protein